MQFVYHKEAGKTSLKLDSKEYSHVLKVRRTKKEEVLFFRNMIDNVLYEYRILDIQKKHANLELADKKYLKIESKKFLHVGWCIVDPKTIEKTLPFLNELGVSKISFVYCKFSQKNFKIDIDRINRILVNSSQQCGRSNMMEIEILKNLNEFLRLYPNSKIIDFSENKMSKNEDISLFLVGCEGGFTKYERKLFDKVNIIGLENAMILRSETAILSISSMILS